VTKTIVVQHRAQQVAGADLAVENPFEVGLAFAALQTKLGDTAPAARRLSSGPLGGPGSETGELLS
jgi:hypothetical protein